MKFTKTEKGRAVAILPQVVEALQPHRKQRAEHRLKYSGLWRDEDLVVSEGLSSRQVLRLMPVEQRPKVPKRQKFMRSGTFGRFCRKAGAEKSLLIPCLVAKR